MHVAKHTRPPQQLTDKLWDLYAAAYHRVSEAAVSREMLNRDEFDAAVADEMNRLWVVWDHDRPVSMALISTDSAATRYVSQAFFERNFPERFARGEVHYVMWVVVDPRFLGTAAVAMLAKGGLALEAAEGALVVFDVPEVNQPNQRGGAASLLIRLARLVGEATLVPLGVQRFFAIDFDRARDLGDAANVTREEVLAAVPSGPL